MKIKVATGFNTTNRVEVNHVVDIPEPVVRQIVMDFFNGLDYDQRVDWIKEKLDLDIPQDD